MGMKHENPSLAELYRMGVRAGEVVEVNSQSMTIAGDFSPGEVAILLRPGARVYILNEDEAICAADGGYRA